MAVGCSAGLHRGRKGDPVPPLAFLTTGLLTLLKAGTSAAVFGLSKGEPGCTVVGMKAPLMPVMVPMLWA